MEQNHPSDGAERFKKWLKDERGRVTKVAQACSRTHSAVIKWDGVVPAEFVLTVEGMSGISRHDLRPDVFGVAVA